ITDSPSAPSAMAMARPIPRDAPVTNATRLVSAIERPHLHRRRDALAQARQNVAGPDLERFVDTHRHELLHRLLPAHRARHLLEEELLDAPRIRVRLRGHIRYHGDGERRHLDALELGAKPLGGRLH